VNIPAQRIQRKRSKGWRVPEGAVYVGRPTIFGNPFSVTVKMKPGTLIGMGYRAVPTVEDAIECYRLYLTEKPELLDQIRKELRGKILMCWCRLDQPCHADVLLEIANKVSA
jgi:hypothetical protein